MGKVTEPKIQASGFMDVLALGIAKTTTERILTPVIGNASVKSGIMKMAGGAVLSGKGGMAGKAISGGLVVDGIEDLVTSVLGGKMGSSGGNSSEAW